LGGEGRGAMCLARLLRFPPQMSEGGGASGKSFRHMPPRTPQKNTHKWFVWQGPLGFSFSLSLSREKSQIQTEQRGFTKWSDVASPASLIIIIRHSSAPPERHQNQWFRSNDWQSVYTKNIPSLEANTSFT